MSGLDNLRKRVGYYGGENQEKRMINDKLRSLKKALLYSYQSETAILSDGREFRCLINPNKETGDYDNKILSIPYEDICLNAPRPEEGEKTSDGITPTNIKCGDVITWKETDTKWLIFLQYLEENAYFRAQIRKCENQVEINGQNYWIYVRGPVETDINWNQKSGIEWNDLNFSLMMYISRDDNTYNYLTRFAKLRIADIRDGKLKTWQVEGVNPMFGDNIIQVHLKEYFENSIELAAQEEREKNKVEEPVIPDGTPNIVGPTTISGYSSATYSIENASNGKWYLNCNNKITELGSKESITVDINMKKGSFTVEYKNNEEVITSKNVTVEGF